MKRYNNEYMKRYTMAYIGVFFKITYNTYYTVIIDIFGIFRRKKICLYLLTSVYVLCCQMISKGDTCPLTI
jgi:hypothetical protein